MTVFLMGSYGGLLREYGIHLFFCFIVYSNSALFLPASVSLLP